MAGERKKLRELVDEFRQVVASRRPWGDALAPPLAFLLLNLVAGTEAAIYGAMGLALLISSVRLVRRRPMRYALGGLGGVVLAALTALLLDRGEAYFLPGMVSGTATSAVCLVSWIARRPLVAWTSHLARRWPIAWYWHPKVRPAYSEVTLAWFFFFAGRLALQVALFLRGAAEALAVANLLLGWPAMVVLLAGSYLYGLRRLRRLGGPSVEEFRAQSPPPWHGQQKGF